MFVNCDTSQQGLKFMHRFCWRYWVDYLWKGLSFRAVYYSTAMNFVVEKLSYSVLWLEFCIFFLVEVFTWKRKLYNLNYLLEGELPYTIIVSCICLLLHRKTRVDGHFTLVVSLWCGNFLWWFRLMPYHVQAWTL